MAGRRKRARETALVSEPFRSYLRELTLRSYVPDFFTPVNHRAIIGFIVGVLFFGFGFVRMFVHPGVPSLGVILVGLSIAALCFVWPLLRGLFVASVRWPRRS